MTQYFQEPTPLPNVLRGYENVLPGGAERILAMVERQAAHRRRIESHGQIFVFSIAASIIATGFLLIATELTP